MTNYEAKGLLESATRLRESTRSWDQRVLLEATSRAAKRTFNSIVEDSLTVQTDGIEHRMSRHVPGIPDDYWAIKNNGTFYSLKPFEEDYEKPQIHIIGEEHPERVLWYDMRLSRITEVFLHNVALYEALGVGPNEPYEISIGHQGLQGRTFTGYWDFPLLPGKRVSAASEALWTREVTLDTLRVDLKNLVYDVADSLFVLFESADVSKKEFGHRVDRYVAGLSPVW